MPKDFGGSGKVPFFDIRVFHPKVNAQSGYCNTTSSPVPRREKMVTVSEKLSRLPVLLSSAVFATTASREAVAFIVGLLTICLAIDSDLGSLHSILSLNTPFSYNMHT